MPSGRNPRVGRSPLERCRIKAVHDFVRSPIATDRDEVPHATRVGVARDIGRVTGAPSGRHFDFKAAGTQTVECGAQQLAACARLRLPDSQLRDSFSPRCVPG